MMTTFSVRFAVFFHSHYRTCFKLFLW